ncbi:MAG: YibE/F family protein [Candidatus Nanopelagicales bacterium]|nr:YibE/F family protein [Candidatus Nanopelagicales bacterium]MDZ4249812.1 YibE/F family protein [Candidatus Nanopelagicales bacterium]
MILVLVSAAAVVLLSRWKGVAALAGLAVSIAILAVFVLPALILGAPPVPVAAVGAAAIVIASMGLAHGFNVRTGVALTGAVIALRRLYAAGMRVGRDHVAATVNTLVLAYIGAALPLFLILIMSEAPASQSLTTELVAQEVVRSLVGGLGIVAAVPLTTFMAAWVLTRKADAAAA